MTNNEVLKRVCALFEFSHTKTIEIFALGGARVRADEVEHWLQTEDDSQICPDESLARFLNGLIIEKRGKKEGPEPVAETVLNFNDIFRKIKIALNLQAEEVLEVFQSVHYSISKHELSALFRSKGHKHYRECSDDVLRNFFNGLEMRADPQEIAPR